MQEAVDALNSMAHRFSGSKDQRQLFFNTFHFFLDSYIKSQGGNQLLQKSKVVFKHIEQYAQEQQEKEEQEQLEQSQSQKSKQTKQSKQIEEKVAINQGEQNDSNEEMQNQDDCKQDEEEQEASKQIEESVPPTNPSDGTTDKKDDDDASSGKDDQKKTDKYWNLLLSEVISQADHWGRCKVTQFF